MGFDSKSGFHSGHTQALDLGDLDKHAEREDEWEVGGKGGTGWDERKRVSGWAEDDEWGDFGGQGGKGGKGGGHTQALDVEELRGEGDLGGGDRGRGAGRLGRRRDDFDDAPRGKRGGGGGGGWGDEPEDFDDEWGGGGGGGRSSGRGGGGGGGWADEDDDWGGGGGGGGGGHTQALDLGELEGGPPRGKGGRGRERGRHGELLDELESRQDKVRYEDSRAGNAEEDRKGRKSYSAGQGAKGISAERDASAERARDASARQRSRVEQEQRRMRVEVDPDEPLMPLPGGPRHAGGGEELAPHERTMALEVERMTPAAVVASGMDLPRTEALDLNELRRGAAAQAAPPKPAAPLELAPHERTHALDLGSLQGGALPATQALRPVSGPPADPLKTAALDPSELENFQRNEVSSGAQLLIFVDGAEPVAFDLRPGITNIGRDRSNHLVLADPHSSRKHARIKKNPDGTFEVHDQGTGNRTLINGQLNQDSTLHHGDEIQIGQTVMRFILGRPSQADWAWPDKVRSVQSGHTASVRVPEELMEEPAQAPAPARKTNKLLVAILVAFILGTLALIAAAVVYILFGDQLLGA